MKSAFLIQRPEKIYIHTNTPKLTGKYWNQLLEIPGFQDCLVIKQVNMPTQVFGVEFYWNAHKVGKFIKIQMIPALCFLSRRMY